MLVKLITKYIKDTLSRNAVIEISDMLDKHPPLHNYKCHQNSAWHLRWNQDVVAVAKGFYENLDGRLIAHFICLDKWGNWFDPTLPTAYIVDRKFYIVEIYKTTEEFHTYNCDHKLSGMKETMYKCLPWYLKLFTKAGNF